MREQTKPLKNVQDEDEEEDSSQEEMQEEQQSQTQQILETGAVTPTKGRHVIHCLTIVGQVEGHYILPPQNKTTKYEHVIPQLVAIQENPEIKGLIMILNTVGGDVEAGLAIAELISGMKKPTVSLVLGGGHSIGVPLAVSARRSFIVPSATMTIHPVRMNGVVLGVPQTLSYFDKMQERIVRFVEQNSNINGDEFRKLMMNTGELVMDVGTVLDGEQAVEQGLIDQLGGLSDAIQCLYEMIDEMLDQENNQEEEEGPSLASPRAVAQLRHMRRSGINRPRRVPLRTGAAALRSPHQYDTTGQRPRQAVDSQHGITGQASAAENQQKAARRGSRGQAKAAPAFNGGGEHCGVNPFGHPSPDAD